MKKRRSVMADKKKIAAGLAVGVAAAAAGYAVKKLIIDRQDEEDDGEAVSGDEYDDLFEDEDAAGASGEEPVKEEAGADQ